MPKDIVRAESHALATTEVVRRDMARTIAAYRRVVRLCATIALTHWPEFKDLRAQERQQALEQLVHATKQRPVVRYPQMARVLGQMPSYLRRAALSAALGVVSSYLSNYANWLDKTPVVRPAPVKGSGKKRKKAPLGDNERELGGRPPQLGFSNVYPSLYGGNMILEDSKLRSTSALAGPSSARSRAAKAAFAVRIKLLGADGQWRFSAPLKVKGRMKRLPNRLDLSPSLVLKGAKAMLVCPVALTPPRYPKFKDVGRVCAVDVGINTALTAVVVSSTGTVIARTFLTCGRHDGQRDALRERIQEKQSVSGRVGRGFCRDLYRRIAGLSLDAARQLSSQLVAFARAHGAQAFVFEALKGWKPKGRGRVQRKRFHRFQHRALFKAVALRAEELGWHMLEVFAGGTSRWAAAQTGTAQHLAVEALAPRAEASSLQLSALKGSDCDVRSCKCCAAAYDGSGKVVRDAKNAQLATFASGKQYNADLNAANNIAARGLALLYGIKNPRPAKAPVGGVRMPLVLADVWAYARALGASLTALGALSDAPGKSPVAIY